jgi:hypothetical protein
MDIDDKELFSSAMADDQIPEAAEQPADAPAPETPRQEDRPRDEHGRFAASRQAAQEVQGDQPEQAAEVPQAKEEANVPSWRLREVREEAERRIAEERAQWQRQFEMLQRQNQPKPEPKPAPDLFENPNGAIEYGVQQYVDPQIQQMREELAQLKAAAVSEREETSRELAVEKYGEDVVRSAYTWIAQGIQSRDPNVVHAYNQAMQARRPFEVIVQAHKEMSLMQQIKAAGGVDQWREQQLAAGQPQAQQSSSRQQSNDRPQGSIVKLPPSMSRIPASQLDGDDDGDMSDAALFKHAMR